MVEELAELAHPVAVGQRVDCTRHRRHATRGIVHQLECGLGQIVRIVRIEALEASGIGAVGDQVADVARVQCIDELATHGCGVADDDLFQRAALRIGEGGGDHVVLQARLVEPVEGQAGEQRVTGTKPPVG